MIVVFLSTSEAAGIHSVHMHFIIVILDKLYLFYALVFESVCYLYYAMFGL